tara:strand:+ start:4583 stop:5533 length:951 start_codon:yes stop_codon:yes gene_type:complete
MNTLLIILLFIILICLTNTVKESYSHPPTVRMIPEGGARKEANTYYTVPSGCVAGCNNSSGQGVGSPNSDACKIGNYIYRYSCKNPPPPSGFGESGPKQPPSPTSKYMGCYNNYPRILTGWDPNNLANNPDRNEICKKRAMENNNKYYALENNNGCLVFDEDSYTKLAGPSTILNGSNCSADYGKNKICCGQPSTEADLAGHVRSCPEEYPICTDYIANKHMGKCVTEARSKARVKPPTTNNIEKHAEDCIGGGEVSVHQIEYTTFHPPPPPPHAPWNIDSHISHIQNPIMGYGEFNDPLPSVNAIFLKRENPNIH